MQSPFGSSRIYEPGSALLANAYVQLHFPNGSCAGRTGGRGSAADRAAAARRRADAADRLRAGSAVPRGVLVLVHGLGGAADSPNTLRLARAACDRGWRVAAVDMRGAGGPASQPRLYTAADVDEIDAALAHAAVASIDGPRVAVGISLGGGHPGAVARFARQRGAGRRRRGSCSPRRTCLRAPRRSAWCATASTTGASRSALATAHPRRRARLRTPATRRFRHFTMRRLDDGFRRARVRSARCRAVLGARFGSSSRRGARAGRC